MSGELPDPDSGGPGTSVEEITPSTSSWQTITEVLQRDILGAEFLVALFSSAMNSFRHDSILRPFPTMFMEGGAESSERSEREEQKKDIEGLVCNSGEREGGGIMVTSLSASVLQGKGLSVGMTIKATKL